MSIKTLLQISIPLYIVHAIEEYSTGILKLDPLFRWVESSHLPTVILYMVEQVLLVLLLFWAISKPKLWLLIFIGLIFLIEILHIIPALKQMSYYPGLVTAILLLLLAYFYWKELILNFKNL